MPADLDLEKLAENVISLAEKAPAGPWIRQQYSDYAIQVVHGPVFDEASSLPDVTLVRRNDDWCGTDEEQDAAMSLMCFSGTHLAALAREFLALAREAETLRRKVEEYEEHMRTCSEIPMYVNEHPSALRAAQPEAGA